MRIILAICDADLLGVWVLVVWGIIPNVRPVLKFADAMESASGLGLWFKPVFLIALPLALAVLCGVVIPQRKKVNRWVT